MTREERLKALFDELERDAYNAEYHNYYYKEANQIIRKHFELSLPPAEGAVPDNAAEQNKRMREWFKERTGLDDTLLSIHMEQIDVMLKGVQPQPTAEGAEEILDGMDLGEPIQTGEFYYRSEVLKAMTEFATLHAQRIADKMVEKMSPSNEQIHEAALAWARDHSEAPDKDCPDWLIRDYEAGAYFVRQCYGCWNKTDKTVEERLREEYKRGIEDGKIIGKHGSVSFIE